MRSDTELQATVAKLLPDTAAVAASLACPSDAALMGAEKDVVGSMVAKRFDEFRHGRHCARQALAATGCRPVAIPKRDDRSPQWPDGYTGSITHTGTIAIAAAAQIVDFASLGVDIETATPLEDDTRRMILLPAEADHCDGEIAKLIFSIKESVYKCLYPHVQTYIDFREMEIRLDTTERSYRAIPHSDKVATDLTDKLQGRYSVTGDYVISSAWLPAA